MDTTKKNKQNLVIKVMAVIASLLIIIILVQHFSGKKNKLLILQNEKFKKEIREARIEINKYKGISARLDSVVIDANIKILEKESKIARQVSQNIIIQKENKKLSNEIREIKDDYLEIIDSLLVERGINTVLNSMIEELEDKIEILSEKVGFAEALVLENTVAVPLKENTYGKRQKTAMAKKTSILKVCFDILENKIIEPGFLDIYLRIFTPDAYILKEDDNIPNTFFHPVYKKDAEFTKNEIVNYKNEKMNVCISFKSDKLLKPGLYLVELFTEKQKLGTTTFTLK